MKKLLAIILTLVLALSLAACGAKQDALQESSAVESTALKDGDTVGDGKTPLHVAITNAEGETIAIIVNTDEKTVGEALQKLGLIDGEEGEWGIYIKTVNGETHIYEEDGMYWAFYINGEYAAAGADMTAIDPDMSYAFAAEKG